MNPVYLPVREPQNPFDEPDIRLVTESRIAFHSQEPVYMMSGEQLDNPGLRYYEYVCASCYAACGYQKSCFTTSWASRNNMRKGPTDKQQDQMRDHADQHSIIWNWARQQDKK